MAPPLFYSFGSKVHMLGQLKRYVQDLDFDGIVEPCAGGGAFSFMVYDARPEMRKQRTPIVFNDIDPDVYNLYHQAKNNIDELSKAIASTLYSRETWVKSMDILKGDAVNADPLVRAYRDSNDILDDHPTNHTQLQRAWAVWVKYHLSYSSAGDGFARNGWGKIKTFTNVLKRKKDEIKRAAAVLENAIILNMDVLDVIEKYAAPKKLFYIDPPYPGCRKRGYAKGWNLGNLLQLFANCQDKPGYFMVSHFDDPGLSDYVKRCGWYQDRYEMKHAIKAEAGARKVEVITRNFPINFTLPLPAPKPQRLFPVEGK